MNSPRNGARARRYCRFMPLFFRTRGVSRRKLPSARRNYSKRKNFKWTCDEVREHPARPGLKYHRRCMLVTVALPDRYFQEHHLYGTRLIKLGCLCWVNYTVCLMSRVEYEMAVGVCRTSRSSHCRCRCRGHNNYLNWIISCVRRPFKRLNKY